MQKSRSFLFPLFNFSSVVARACFKTYIGHAGYEGEDIWGNYFYVEITHEDNKEYIKKELRNHKRFVIELYHDESVIYVFEFSEYEKENIVGPFTMGKYSKICREYVNDKFPKLSSSGAISSNWRILMKDDWAIPSNVVPLRVYWKNRMGVELPKDAEVWPKPRMKDEVFGQIVDNEDIRELLSNKELV